MAETHIPLIDLRAQRERLRPRVDRAIARVLDRGQFVLGSEVEELEERLAALAGVEAAVTCSSGTDALLMVLLEAGIGPGDAVFVPAFTFISTAGAVVLAGATPVLVDIQPDTYLLDAASLERAVDAVRRTDLEAAAVIPVDLFGQPADYEAIGAVAREHGLLVLCDAGQSFGAGRDGRRVGGFGDATATSFFPTKPLGCYGDGGAVLTRDRERAARLRALRVHGCPGEGDDCARVGINGRLDTLQAAVLLEKLALFEEELAARRRVAQRYQKALDGCVETPRVAAGAESAWAAYTVKHPDRDRLARELAQRSIGCRVYYPKPLHHHTAYRERSVIAVDLGASESAAGRVLSLPMHPYLSAAEQDRVIETVRAAGKG